MEIKSNNDFKYDLELGQMFEGSLSDILSNKKIEVKTDLLAFSTGNLFVEIESRGKLSGLSTTQADYYAFIIPIDDDFITILISVSRLKEIVKKRHTGKFVSGGDDKTSKGVLIRLTDIWRQK